MSSIDKCSDIIKASSLVHTSSGPLHVSVCKFRRGMMYWTDVTARKIYGASIDGTEVRELVTSGLDIPGNYNKNNLYL